MWLYLTLSGQNPCGCHHQQGGDSPRRMTEIAGGMQTGSMRAVSVLFMSQGNESCQESTGTKPTTEGSGLAGSVRTGPGLGACGGRTYWMLLQPSINIFPCPRVLDPSISIHKYPSLLVPSSPLWAESPMMAIMASRPLLISAVKLFFFFSGS